MSILAFGRELLKVDVKGVINANNKYKTEGASFTFPLPLEAEALEIREPRWDRGSEEALACLGKEGKGLAASRKGAVWKVALARHLRARFLVPHG